MDRRGTGARAGLGLGLSIAKALAEAMHGQLMVESDGLGHGATFTLELQPGVANDRPALPEETTVASDEDAKPSLLLVDDHPDTLRTLSLILQRAGYVVQTADTFAQAVTIMDSCEVLVSDIDLPDGNGCELMRRFKASGGRAGIAVSGFGSEEDMRRTKEAGFSQSLVKPIEVSQLMNAIRALQPELKLT